MATKKVDRPRCSGRWSEAQYVAFIKSQLRGASWKWGPTVETHREARRGRGQYECNVCKQIVPPTLNRQKNIAVDHIIPIVNPETGFTSWNDFVNGLFCEKDNLQLICKACHTKKSKEESDRAKERRKKANGNI